MQDRVGNGNPSPEMTDDIAGRLAGIAAEVKPFTVKLSSEERQRTTKFRPGGERIVELVALLAQKYLSEFPGLSIAGMKNDLALAEQLRPLAAQTKALAEILSDTALEAESECWWVTTAYYTALARIAASNPKLAGELRPAIDFFATGRRKKATTETPSP